MLQVLKHSSVSSSVAGAGSKGKSAFLGDQTGTVSLRDKARDHMVLRGMKGLWLPQVRCSSAQTLLTAVHPVFAWTLQLAQ